MISFKDYFLVEMNLVNKDDLIDAMTNRYIKMRPRLPIQGKQWLLKNVVNWILKQEGEPLRPLVKAYLPSQSDPAWMQPYRQKTYFHGEATGLYKFDKYEFQTNGQHYIPRNLDHVADWIQILDERELNKLQQTSVEQAIQKSIEWLEQMYRRTETSVNAGDEEIAYEFSDGYTIKRLLTKQARQREGKLMGHCVGSDSYDDEDITIYSLRDPKNNPHVTIEVEIRHDYRSTRTSEVIQQIKGKENNAPVEKYWPYLEEWITRVDFEVWHDGDNIGMLDYNDRFYFEDSPRWEEIYKTEIEPANLKKFEQIKKKIKNGVYRGDINLYGLYIKELPDLSDITVEGDFRCDNNIMLTSLKGSPREVYGTFTCYSNYITSLEGCPERVHKMFSCAGNLLTNLVGGPKIAGRYRCDNNYINSLEGAPEKTSVFSCTYNELTSLDNAPICDTIYAGSNKIKDPEKEKQKLIKKGIAKKVYV